MATSSFSKNFVISDQKVVKDLLYAIDNPTEIQLRKTNPSQEQKKQDVLCAIKKQLASMN